MDLKGNMAAVRTGTTLAATYDRNYELQISWLLN
jgi:hypothetical protein